MVAFTKSSALIAFTTICGVANASLLRGLTNSQPCQWYSDTALIVPVQGKTAPAGTIGTCSTSPSGHCVCKDGMWAPSLSSGTTGGKHHNTNIGSNNNVSIHINSSNAPTADPTADPTATDPTATEDKCYALYSQMSFNNLVQEFPDNPDSQAHGFATCKLCTSGTMTCTANVYGGQTELIASHIHLAKDGNGSSGSGPPVINFCGNNGKGMINDGTDYKEECMQYDGDSALNNAMEGALVASTTDGQTVADLVNDIGTDPSKYYMNFHSIASWSHWQQRANGGEPAGMCRGVMALSSSS